MLDIAAGLGNQLFRYSASYSMAKATGRKLYIRISNKQADRKMLLDQFKLYPNTHIIQEGRFKDILPKIIIIVSNALRDTTQVTEENFFNIKHSTKSGILSTQGSFESEIYFLDVKDEIRKFFIQHVLRSDSINQMLYAYTYAKRLSC
jgi:hypothetical protein